MNFADPVIKLQDFQLQRGHKELFPTPVSTTFAPGALNIVAGENGSGKSSLLDVVGLRTKPPKPSMMECPKQMRARDIAYLPQQLWDVFDIRICDLVILGVGFHSNGPADSPETLADALSNRTRSLGMLSGGQRQLLMFWLVSSQPKNVFVYDEPTRYLDCAAASFVVKTIEGQVKKGMVVLVSEHSSETRWDVACHRVRLAAQAAAAKAR